MNDSAIALSVAGIAALIFLAMLAHFVSEDQRAEDAAHHYVACAGEFRETTRQQVAVVCNDGRIYVYTAYKYNLTRKESHK